MNIDKPVSAAIGVGDPKIICKLAEKFSKNENISLPNLIHPNVIGDWENIELGIGNIICAGNIFTTDIKIGSFNVFNLSCTIGHDCIIGNCNVFNPIVNISGGINLGNSVLVGTGAQILQYLKITDNVIIGSGAVVTKDLEEEGAYVGIPCRKVR